MTIRGAARGSLLGGGIEGPSLDPADAGRPGNLDLDRVQIKDSLLTPS
ncbi:MAG: hypothetical protein IT180_17720 [Acidobacteria bacterium]|nr:hypothetical protein [Acidobacteriota bacterium]